MTRSRSPVSPAVSPSVRPTVFPLVILALALLGIPRMSFAQPDPRDVRAAIKELAVVVRTGDMDGFLEISGRALEGGDKRAVRAVAEGFADLVERSSNLDPEAYHAFHVATAKLLGRVKSLEGVVELKGVLEKSRKWRARLIALDAAAVNAKIDRVEAVYAALDDDAAQVVRRALHFLRNVLSTFDAREKRLEATERILARFKAVDDPKKHKGGEWDRTRLAFRSTLTVILHVSLASADDYENYLSTRRDRADLFDERDESEGITGLTLFGTEVTGKNIVFILDVSGSMMATDQVKLTANEPRSGRTVVRGSEEEKKLIRDRIESRRRINRAKSELAKVVNALPEDVQFNLMTYSSEVELWKPKLVPVREGSRKEAQSFIEGMKAQGVTVTDVALETAFEDVEIDTIYLITDGAPTHRGSSGPQRPEDADALIGYIHQRMGVLNFLRGVRIFTLGFPEAEEEFLQDLSKAHSGKYTAID